MRCIVMVAIYAALIIATFAGVGNLVNTRLSSIFMSADKLVSQEDVLESDDFTSLSQYAKDGTTIIVFDGVGSKLYSSGGTLASEITANELSVINDYVDDYRTYSVLSEVDEDGDEYYHILLCSSDSDNIQSIDGECTLSDDLVILSGNLFPGKTKLTALEFGLIRGMVDNKVYVEKYEYETYDGEPRTLVLAVPTVTTAQYEQAVQNANLPWFFAIPGVIALTVAAVLLLISTIRRAVRPLDEAIEARRNGGTVTGDRDRLPSELRPTYDNFMELMDELDAAQLEKQRIIADVSHDLKTPISVIGGYAQALTDGTIPPEAQDKYLKVIHDRSIAAADMIDSLFSYAKIEHPEYRPVFVVDDVCELTRKVVIACSAAVEQAGCTVEADIAEERCPARIDVQLYERILSNLIENAFKHNPVGTRILVRCHENGDYVVVSVLDTGNGIPDAIRAKAFDAFVTENESRSPGKGTGLGLYVVRRCAELIGASVGFANTAPTPYVTEVDVRIPLELA